MVDFPWLSDSDKFGCHQGYGWIPLNLGPANLSFSSSGYYPYLAAGTWKRHMEEYTLGTGTWKGAVTMELRGSWGIEWKDYLQCLYQTRAFLS